MTGLVWLPSSDKWKVPFVCTHGDQERMQRRQCLSWWRRRIRKKTVVVPSCRCIMIKAPFTFVYKLAGSPSYLWTFYLVILGRSIPLSRWLWSWLSKRAESDEETPACWGRYCCPWSKYKVDDKLECCCLNFCQKCRIFTLPTYKKIFYFSGSYNRSAGSNSAFCRSWSFWCRFPTG